MTRSQDLRRLMDEHGLTRRDVAQMTGHSYETVLGWMTRSPVRHREPSRQVIELIRLKLERRE